MSEMTLRAEDGTPLIPKEGIVLDEDGNTIAVPSQNDSGNASSNDPFRNKVRIFKLSGWLAPLIVVGIVAVFAMGTFFFIAGLLIISVIALIRFLIRSLTS